MTNSRITGGAAIGLPRLFSFLLLAALPLGAVTPPAQQRSLVGHWRGVDRGATVTIEIQPNGQYIQRAQSGTFMIKQSGQFSRLGPNRIAFSAANSRARTPQFNQATPPAVGGYSANRHTGMPLGPTNTIVFASPGRIIFTDEKTHHSITMTRVP
jgi:hypothetical protein